MKILKKIHIKYWGWVYDKLLGIRAYRKEVSQVKFKIFNNHWLKVEKEINVFCANKIIINVIQVKASEEQHVIIGVWYKNIH
jgi:hypothetical protein